MQQRLVLWSIASILVATTRVLPAEKKPNPKKQTAAVVRLALVSGTYVKTGNLEIALASPASLSLVREGTMARLMVDSEKPVQVTLQGLAKAGPAAVARADADGIPVESIAASLKDNRINFKAEPRQTYLIGPEKVVYRPRLFARFDREARAGIGDEGRIVTTLVNPSSETVQGEIRIWAGDQWIVTSPLHYRLALDPGKRVIRTFSARLQAVKEERPRLGVIARCGGVDIPAVTLSVQVVDHPRRADIKIDAADFQGQGGGKVEVTRKEGRCGGEGVPPLG